MKAVITIFLLSLTLPLQSFSQSLSGQHPRNLEKKAFRKVSAKYLLFLPQDYDKTNKRFPLIMYLHGGSLRGEDIERLRTMGLPKLLEQDKSFPFIVVSPLCPAGEIWTDTEMLVGVLDEIGSKYQVDADRVYLTGHSMGGRGALYLAYKYPERFAAIAPMSAISTISAWTDKLKNIPIWFFHGAKDDIVLIKESKTMVDALKTAGGNSVKFTELADRDHFILDMYENQRLYEWFLQHRRKKIETKQ